MIGGDNKISSWMPSLFQAYEPNQIEQGRGQNKLWFITITYIYGSVAANKLQQPLHALQNEITVTKIAVFDRYWNEISRVIFDQ